MKSGACRKAIVPIIAVLSAVLLSTDTASSQGEIDWTRQFGSTAAEQGHGVAADASGVYVVGKTEGTLPNQTSAGGIDAIARKYDHDGSDLWTRQFGSRASDTALAVAADSSGVYVVGHTDGDLPGQTSAGGTDAFVRKYDQDGNELWTSQFGTAASDQAFGVAAVASGVYVAGLTAGALPGQTSAGGIDAFVSKYDSDGNAVWTRQFGTAASDTAFGVADSPSGVYVGGRTFGALPGQTGAGDFDAFVRKYDPDGDELWTSQFGTSAPDYASDVAADSSGVYAAGLTDGALPGQTSAGKTDTFVRKFDEGGNLLWTRQSGSAETDLALHVDVSPVGVYVAGHSEGALPSQANAGLWDAFVQAYDQDGGGLWTNQFGTAASDFGFAVVADAAGIYTAGHTDGALPGQTSAGDFDAFLAKLDPDIDGDDWANGAELYLGTDPLNACMPKGWPPDPRPGPDGNGVVQIDDVAFAAGAFGSASTPRAEIASQNGVVQIDDVSAFASRFGLSC